MSIGIWVVSHPLSTIDHAYFSIWIVWHSEDAIFLSRWQKPCLHISTCKLDKIDNIECHKPTEVNLYMYQNYMNDEVSSGTWLSAKRL